MRTIPESIWAAWSAGGPFIGDNAAHGIVTVEKDWLLHKTEGSTIGTFTKGPVRWWQRADNSQVETVIPNIASISIQRTLDQDSSTCTITLNNQWHHTNGSMSINDVELGQPGYFTFNRGDSLESTARWQQEQNDWNKVIYPNALLRTYQGYGGRDKELQQALDDGNLVLTGVWLIDTIRITTQGRIEIQCRDMAKLLIDQLIYPPLIPSHEYPLQYCRWSYRNFTGTSMTIQITDFLANNQIAFVESGATDFVGAVPEPNYPDYIANEPGNGYWLLLGTGQVISFGNNVNYGSAPVLTNTFTCQMQVTETGKGYYILRNDGALFAFGDAVDYGSTTYAKTNVYDYFSFYAQQDHAAQSFCVTADGNGYWIIFATGRVEGYGSAGDSLGNHSQATIEYPGWLNSNFAVSIATDKKSGGYWTLDQRGHVEAHAGAPWHGQPADGNPDFNNIIAHPDPTKSGYWVIRGNGSVSAHGDCLYYYDIPNSLIYVPPDQVQPVTGYTISGLIPTPDGGGYWLIGIGGGVYPFGNAKDWGALNRNYNLLGREDGNYLDYSDIVQDLLLWAGWYLGGLSDNSIGSNDWRDLSYNDSGWGNAKEICKASVAKTSWGTANGVYMDSAFPDNNASVLWASDGSITSANIGECYFRQEIFIPSDTVYEFHAIVDDAAEIYIDGDIVLTLPGPYIEIDTKRNITLTRGTHVVAIRAKNRPVISGVNNPAGVVWTIVPYGGGNYIAHSDPSCKIKEYLAYEPLSDWKPVVYGNIESTGAWAEECITQEVFDKKPIIDAINTIKEIVGYAFWIDEEGAARFESPNIWSEGNFDELGQHTSFIPDIDERFHITDYGAQMSDASLRSEIIISSSDPTQPLDDTVTTRYVPPNVDVLRGMVRPAVWINEVFTNSDEQAIMAELIALYGWLASRQGSVTCQANPAIQINDQVRIWERQTSETYIHYVRGLSTSMDLETGAYNMTLTTNWMGDGTDWSIGVGGNLTFEDLLKFTRLPVSFRLSSGSAEDLKYHGHKPTDSLDRAPDTFWLSPGNDNNDPYSNMEYIEYSVTGLIDVIGIQPWSGNYVAYISVMEGGYWVGDQVIPYDGTTYDTGDQFDVAIPYVIKVGVGWELPQMVQLVRQYQAQRVRLTFANLQYTSWSPNYRCGLREFAAGIKVV